MSSLTTFLYHVRDVWSVLDVCLFFVLFWIKDLNHAGVLPQFSNVIIPASPSKNTTGFLLAWPEWFKVTKQKKHIRCNENSIANVLVFQRHVNSCFLVFHLSSILNDCLKSTRYGLTPCKQKQNSTGRVLRSIPVLNGFAQHPKEFKHKSLYLLSHIMWTLSVH